MVAAGSGLLSYAPQKTEPRKLGVGTSRDAAVAHHGSEWLLEFSAVRTLGHRARQCSRGSA
jgi:hypothetical protein